MGAAALEGIGAPALLTPAAGPAAGGQAKGGRAGCVPKLAGMPGTELEHNFLGSAGSRERQREGLRRRHGGPKGLPGHSYQARWMHKSR